MYGNLKALYGKWRVFFIVGTALALVYLGVKYILPILLPFILAIILSLAIEPVVGFFTRRLKLRRGVAVALAMVVVFGMAGLLLSLLITRLFLELKDLSAYLPQLSKEVQSFLNSAEGEAANFYWSLPDPLLKLVKSNLAGLQNILGSLMQSLQGLTTNLLNKLVGLVASLPNVILIIIVTGIATFFITRDRSLLVNFWRRIFPQPWGENSLHIIRDVVAAFKGYVKAQGILISITGLQTLIGLYIIGVEYALTMAMVVAFFDILPIFGPSSVFIPWVIWAFMTGNIALAWKLIVLLIILLAVRQVLEAKVVADQLGLHPLATLFSMYLGLQFLGVIGLIVGPLVVISIKALHRAGIINIDT